MKLMGSGCFPCPEVWNKQVGKLPIATEAKTRRTRSPANNSISPEVDGGGRAVGEAGDGVVHHQRHVVHVRWSAGGNEQGGV